MVAVVVALVIVWLVLAGLRIRSAYASANHAKGLLQAFRDDNGGSLSGLKPLTESPDLTNVKKAGTEFGRARDNLGSPLVAPLRVVPVLGRQLGVVETLSDSSDTLISSVVATFDEVTRILERAQSAPSDAAVNNRLSAARELQGALERLVGPVEKLDAGTDVGLVSSVRKARSDFVRNRDELVSALRRTIVSVKGVHAFLEGPNTYVVLAANNGEMRAGSGMYLQVGPLGVDGGAFAMGEFHSTEDMVLPDAGSTFDPELEALWGDFRPTAEWRNVNLTPRFDESARMSVDMWSAAGNPAAQGAISIDILALKRLLKVVGPVSVEKPDGGSVELSADNVVTYLLLEQYKELAQRGGSSGKEERRAHLGDVAKAIFESFNDGNIGLEELMDALIDVGRGRHLMAWSSDPVQQAAWQELGMSGELPENSLLFSLINRGGNKLDQFMVTSSDLSVERVGDHRKVSVALKIQNNTPLGLPSYVSGPHPNSGVGAGDYVGYLTLNVPAGAVDPTVTGGELLATAKDGETRVLVTKVVVPRGEAAELTVGFELAAAWNSIRVEPSGRIPPVEWSFRGKEWSDSSARLLALD